MLRAASRMLLDTLAPRRCASCEAVSEAPLCEGCEAGVLAAPAPAPRHLAASTAVAAFVFDGVVRDAIHRGKYGGDRRALRHLASLASSRLLPDLLHADGLVAVALAPRRLRGRGYNQAEEIATVLARSAGRPVLPGLARIRETAPQAEHRREALRVANVEGAFEWRGADISGRRLALVDDVLTTGATAVAAAAAMQRAGVSRVDIAVLAAVL